MRNRTLRTAAALGLFLLGAASAAAEPATYESPEAAVAAVIAALEAENRDALLTVFGKEFEDVAFTGNPAKDREMWSGFLDSYRSQHRLDQPDENRAVLYVGREQWPFPAEIVASDGTWRFDSAGARDEVRFRRIGLNELDVIDVMHAAVAVQARYRQTDHDGDGVMEFAASILSTPGQRDGLYWPDAPGTPESPIGAFIARASADGYNFDGTDEAPDPYLGYYFRILQKQGPSAPGGALGYMVNGNMVAGHALLAYPAAYGDSGIMSFMVGENGVVHEADLGKDTLAAAGGIDSFDPVAPLWSAQ